MPIRVTVWGENVHEKTHKVVSDIYPKGMHGCIADALNQDKEITAITATLDQPEHGLTDEVLAKTDVLTWWGHAAHGKVEDKIVDRVQKRVLEELRARGRRVPEDVQLIGFDDQPLMDTLGLTTVRQPMAAFGEWAARSIAHLITDPATAVENVQLGLSLIPRATTRPLPAAKPPKTTSKAKKARPG